MQNNYTIRTANTRKKYYVARFNNTEVDFSRFAKPVKMVRDTPHENEEESHRVRKVNPDRVKKYPWVIEDADNQYSFIGTVEGGQSSHYVLLMHQKTEHGSEFRVLPTADWYNFRIKRPTKITMTTEEAEAKLLITRRQQTERLNRVKLSGETKKDRDDEEDRTTNNDSGDDSFSAFGRFDSDEERDKLKRLKSGKKKGGDNENEEEEEEEHEADEKTGREDLDYQDNPSDDEEESVPVDENNTAKNANNDENSDSERKLSADGKKMQDLITKTRNAEKEEGEAEDPENPFASDSDKEDSFKLNDLIPEYVSTKPKAKPKSEIKEEEEGAPAATTDSTSPTTTASSSTSEKHKKETKHKKRKTSSEGKHETAKKPKKESHSAPVPAPVATPVKEETGEVTETELRSTLLQRGKIKTGKLIKLFKPRLSTQEKKTRFLNLVQKITKMVEENGDKFIVLKDDSRY
eukprot:TRINITY_DN3464_c0_g1_i1.p1 TRINITY_DN3464_c0_g1~~TRINITY_DN3464_c0_g1_i1.p1  ORF type:complete len:471 (-),score=129.11 TRINITY_DN3464_c0_g1_i1:62-1450(-)